MGLSVGAVGGAGRLSSSWGWARTEPLLTAAGGWEGVRIWEPTCLIDNPNSVYRLYFDAGNAPASTNQGMGYATCPLASDPTVAANWTRGNSGSPILGQGGSGYSTTAVSGSNVYLDGSGTYYGFFYDGSTTSNLYVATSSDGLTWNTPTVAIAKAQAAWIKGWANSFVWRDGGSWRMLCEGATVSGSPMWATNYATSNDGLTWTVQGSGPITQLQLGVGMYGGPWVLNTGATVNGRLWMFYHAALTSDSNTTSVYAAYSLDNGSSWTPATTAQVRYTGGVFSTTQTADASVVEHGGKTYLFYSGVNLSTTSYINVAVFAGSLSTLLNPPGA